MADKEKELTLPIKNGFSLRLDKRSHQNIAVFTVGSLAYSAIEILWRGYTHWTMMITGGICFVVLFRVFCKIARCQLWKKCMAGAGIITSIEFLAGCIVNLGLRMDVWDYSYLPFNLLGQICPLYSFLWGLLSIPAVYLTNRLQKLFSR